MIAGTAAAKGHQNANNSVPHAPMEMIEEPSNSLVLEEYHDALDMEMVPPLDLKEASPDPDESSEGGCRKLSFFVCLDRCGSRQPRLFAFWLGLIAPLFSLIIFAVLCGYPLAFLESPLELDQNDDKLEYQMRLLVETSLYTNITQNLPRICVSLYYTNSSVDEYMENITKVIQGPPALDKYHILRDYTQQQVDQGEEITFGEWMNGTSEAAGGNYSYYYDSYNQSNDNETFFVPVEEHYHTEVEVTIPLLDTALPEEVVVEEDSVVNTTELSQFVVECGIGLSPLIDKMFLTMAKTASNAISDGLRFAWSMCPTNTTPFQENLPQAPSSFLWDAFFARSAPTGWSNIQEYFPVDPQSVYYRQRWEKDRRRLYNRYLNYPRSAMNKTLEERIDALVRKQTGSFYDLYNRSSSTGHSLARQIYAYEMSLHQATGRNGCVPHVPAACWFWFTVMTTIGYGNTSPATWGGRWMVFTLGFVTIILFGGVSARAAYVITSLMEDLLTRLGAKWLLHRGMITLLWGIIYYAWMLLIAYYYVWWQQDRLGQDGVDDIKTGYWFAYISTTTVGFGDYYLDAAVLRATDLLIYPLMFLLGFSFLAAFLTKLSEVITRPFRDGESLVAKFKKSDDEKAALKASKTASSPLKT